MTADPDAALIALLIAVPNLNVYDGYVDADETLKVIAVPLPYVVFYSTPGYDNDPRFCGLVAGRVFEFSITGVAEDRNQAKWALEKARGALSRKRVNGSLVIRAVDNPYVRRDDDFTTPGGAPLFYGIDRYSVAAR